MTSLATPLDHAYAEEHGLVEAYLQDTLSESERDAFEAHYFACAECMAQLEAASDFREGMLQVAAETTARVAQAAGARAPLGLLAGLALLSRGRRLALAGALLLLMILPLGLLLANRGLQRQLAAAHAAEQRIASLEARLQGLQASDAAARRSLEEELAKAREVSAAPAPQVNLPLFALAAVRGRDEPGREPVNRLPLSATAPSVLFDLALATVDYPSYTAVLRDATGREVWQGRDLHPDGRDSLVVLLPSRLLPAGLYRLTITGVKSPEAPEAVVAGYPFRVVRVL